jgi:hypothetical protein
LSKVICTGLQVIANRVETRKQEQQTTNRTLLTTKKCSLVILTLNHDNGYDKRNDNQHKCKDINGNVGNEPGMAPALEKPMQYKSVRYFSRKFQKEQLERRECYLAIKEAAIVSTAHATTINIP